MILAFKPQFVEPILVGTKIHTIRTDSLGRWKRDNTIHMATGGRTPNYHQFNADRPDLQKCISVQKLDMVLSASNKPIARYWTSIESWVDDRQVSLSQIAKNDGFLQLQDFIEWFFIKNTVFSGKIIRWTDFKY